MPRFLYFRKINSFVTDHEYVIIPVVNILPMKEKLGGNPYSRR
jgi:hypothetical protein